MYLPAPSVAFVKLVPTESLAVLYVPKIPALNSVLPVTVKLPDADIDVAFTVASVDVPVAVSVVTLVAFKLAVAEVPVCVNVADVPLWVISPVAPRLNVEMDPLFVMLSEVNTPALVVVEEMEPAVRAPVVVNVSACTSPTKTVSPIDDSPIF
jgi:hypothetical protein